MYKDFISWLGDLENKDISRERRIGLNMLIDSAVDQGYLVPESGSSPGPEKGVGDDTSSDR